MTPLTLIWFEGCPNADRAREALRRAGRPWREVRQDDLPADHPLRQYSSPTVLDGERLIFGSATSAAGCSIAPLSVDRLLADLQRGGAAEASPR